VVTSSALKVRHAKSRYRTLSIEVACQKSHITSSIVNAAPVIHPNSIVLLRRDLRLHDNSALNAALRQSGQVYPCFILDKTLLDQLDGDLPRIQYMLCALQELDATLRELGSQLYVVYDHPVQGLSRLQHTIKAEAVFFHRDVSPYATRRDAALQAYCGQSATPCHVIDDVTLHPPEQTLKPDGTPYTVFTPFFRRAFLLPVPRPQKTSPENLAKNINGDFSLQQALAASGLENTRRTSPANDAKAALKNIGQLQAYEQTRDIPSLAGTSRLSALLRFGVISSREAWWAIAQVLGNEHPLLRQLYWRDFFFSIGLYFPRVFSGCFNQQYNRITWPDKQQFIAAWQNSQTGFPIVDAGLRELQETGFMHNRVRMIVASFLVKDLHCDWRIGEKHFAQQLVDYDPCINNGNWQWAASTGCDAQPYFRIFNPWTQQQKFDPDCTYIKRWLPELNNIPAKTLHNLFKLNEALPGYVMPVVDHGTQTQIAKRLFEDVRRITF
jgi:deoxyribodipyrimidine photo-lyase